MKKQRFYVGLKAGSRQVFKSDVPPTEITHGNIYNAVVGPFDTKRGATWAASPAAVGNPHYQTVADAERIAKLPDAPAGRGFTLDSLLRGFTGAGLEELQAGHQMENGVCVLCDAGDPTSCVPLSEPCSGR